jgi:hypothetical protein
MTAHMDRWDGRFVEIDSVSNQRRYRIVIRGRLSDRLGSAFAEMSLERHPGQTVMSGPADQTRLHELLDRLRDLGIEPVSVDADD